MPGTSRSVEAARTRAREGDAPDHRRPLEPDWHIRVAGLLDAHWQAYFDGLSVEPDGVGSTLLRGPLPDQAALFGMLLRVRDLGLPLLSVTRASEGGVCPRS